jgi:hypothetical protein
MDVYDSLTLSKQVKFIKEAINNMPPSLQKEVFDYFLDEIKEKFNLIEIED